MREGGVIHSYASVYASRASVINICVLGGRFGFEKHGFVSRTRLTGRQETGARGGFGLGLEVGYAGVGVRSEKGKRWIHFLAYLYN